MHATLSRGIRFAGWKIVSSLCEILELFLSMFQITTTFWRRMAIATDTLNQILKLKHVYQKQIEFPLTFHLSLCLVRVWTEATRPQWVKISGLNKSATFITIISVWWSILGMNINLKQETHSLPPMAVMGLLPDTYNWELCMRRESRERFPRHRGLGIPKCITAHA